GGIIAFNVSVDAPLAERLNAFFSEVILAPEFSSGAIEVLKKKKDRRLVQYNRNELRNTIGNMHELRSVIGGVLEQTADQELLSNSSLESVTSHSVSEERRAELI